ncbi:MAG: TraB/GumN family protein [Deltaproteobacteria bacterium]|nr:TraB/GumN family protein [Deltaproteobacteria bacterium]
MKTKLLVLICTVLFSSSLHAETSLWKVQSGSSVIYLGGTIHILRSSDFPLPKEFDSAYADSKIITFETDLDAMQSPEIQQLMVSQGMYSDGRTLDKVLSKEAYGKLKKYCDGLGLPLEALNRMKPSMVVFTVLALELKKLGVDSGGVDFYYDRKAAADGKKRDSLETLEEQIGFLTAMGEGNESNFVIHSIDDFKETSTLLDEMISAWRAGDIQKLSDLFVKDIKKEFPKLYKNLLTDRNKKWLKKIDAYMKTPEKEFLLVGVAHMLGKEGLINQLKKRGYEVTKL